MGMSIQLAGVFPGREFSDDCAIRSALFHEFVQVMSLMVEALHTLRTSEPVVDES